MKRLVYLFVVFFLALLLFLAPFAKAQGTYPAASCSEAAILAAITAEQVHPADHDIISIPSGNCTWTGSQQISQTFNNSVVIQGGGAISATTGGVSTTGIDSTVITDNIGSNGAIMSFITTAGKSFRFTGIAVEGNGSSSPKTGGVIAINGTSSAVRIDHCHFVTPNSLSVGPFLGGSVIGVIDHNFFDNPSGTLNNSLAFHNGAGWNGASSSDFGDNSWATADNFGTVNFMYVEDNQFSNGDIGDGGGHGSRYVLRHNTIKTTSLADNGQMYNHGLTSDRRRGQRAAEVYLNTWTQPGTTGVHNPAFSINSGTLLFWGNTITQFYGAIQIDYTRKDNSTYPYGSPPSGWGNCNPPSSVFTAWDGPSPGYPCMDQVGRGAGNLMNGQSFPNELNTRTGTIAFMQQALSPIYLWNNTYTPSGGYSPTAQLIGDSSGGIYADNVDYYQQFGTYGEAGSFNGTKGVGQGLLSARPATCTAGPGGNTPGVGYWATDTNTLYVCNPTNSWSVYYMPYTYPHPLAGGSTGTGVNPPTNLAATVQ
jgi:hypothetical protein